MLTLVDRQEQFSSLVDQLRVGATYCIDTEFDSRADKTTLCLLQLRASDETYVIDSLAIRDLSPLAPALGNPDSTWVLHGAHQDIPLLLSALRIAEVPKLFDTQIAWGLISPEPTTSFAYLTYKLLGRKSSKFHQTDDWTRRPLSESQIAYAAHDVDSLPRMYEILMSRIAQLGRNQVVLDACHEHLCGVPEASDPISLESFRNAWQLEPEGQLVLRDLINWYNGLSQSERSRTIEAKLLWSLANRLPQTPEALRQVRGMPRLHSAQQERILSIVRNSLQNPLGATHLIEPPPYATFERLELDAWLEYVRTMACSKAQVSKELVLAGRRLRQLREALLTDGLDTFNVQSLSKILGPWQYSLIGETLAWAVQKIGAPKSLLDS
jgi:ribonuclease D